MRSSICPSTGRTSTLGSSSPVGRMTCSTIWPERLRSYSPGVAETYTTWLSRGLELVKFQRPVVKGAGQPEAVVHQGGLPGPVPVVHGPHLGQGGVALVDEEYEVLGEVVQQGVGGRSGGPALDNPGVVLNARAVPQFLHHLDVVHGALFDALGLHQLVLAA